MIAAVDRLLAALGLVAAAPLLAVAAAAVRRGGNGPVLYRSTRVGHRGEPFTMYKLRTMVTGAAQDGRITGADDARVTPVGRRLRRWRLDELPQLVHVLRGQMALVGPRPEDPTIVADHYDAMMRETLTVPPGLTCLGSLSYLTEERDLPADPVLAERHYVEQVLPRKAALDLVYVRHRSLPYSLLILVRTLAGVAGVRRPFRTLAEAEDRLAASILAGGRS